MNKSRGFRDLLIENQFEDEVLEGEVIVELPLSKIKPNPFQPRKFFDDKKINELANSIKENGVFQPIIVKKNHDEYIIVSGERRYRASKKLELETIPAIIRAYDASKVAEIALIENLQREDLNPLEEANAYKNMIGALGITQNELAKKIGKSRSYITNYIGLLSLPEEVLGMLSDGKISVGHAKVLSKINKHERILLLAKEIEDKNLNVRDIEELSKKEKKAKPIKRNRNSKYIEDERLLKAKYGYEFKIDDKKIIIKTKDIKSVIKKLMGDHDV